MFQSAFRLKLARMKDRRKHPRSPVDELAYISGDGSSTRCTIVNLSAEGAAIDVPDASCLPNWFQLMTETDRVVRNCRVAWIIRNRIGVEFERADATLSKPTPIRDASAVIPMSHPQRQFIQYLQTGRWVRAINLPDRPKVVARLVDNGWIERQGIGNDTVYRITAAGLSVKRTPLQIIRKQQDAIEAASQVTTGDKA
jgi:hypothetical protein